MTDLQQLRRELDAARARAADAVQALVAERERLRRLEDAALELTRRFDRRNPEHQRRRDEVERSLAGSRARASELAAAKESALAGLADLRSRLEPLTDPRRAIGAMDARYPVLLFPVRLETRFVTRARAGGPQAQLLVRVYPDDCLVDGFEPDLSEAEVDNLRRYWCGVWKAGGDEALERAAWRELCAAHGAGRALYLVRRYGPLAGSDPVPARTTTSDVVLVIATASAITPAVHKAAIADYWIAAWRANNDEAPYDALRSAVGDARAAEVRSTIVPFNRGEQPGAGVDRAAVPVAVVFLVLAPAEDAAVKRQTWTRPPAVSLLPERLLLIADSGAEHVEVLGGMVQQPLAVGPDPLAEGGEQFDQVDGDLVVPPALEWMTDFEAALRAGMAFRVDLTPRQAALGFDRLYVLGVRLTSDEERGKHQLEELIQHHAQSQDGFALLPQGTPTNNTDDGASGWSRVQEADELFDVARSLQAGLDRFDATATAAYEKKDGLALAEALGIDAAVLQHVPNADGSDQAEARALNAVLWPATLGYWMDTEMRPIFDDATTERARRHFIDRVSGRGIVPAVRIGSQPYGVLPTAAFSRMEWPGFLGGLQNLLRMLAQMFWNGFGDNAPHVGHATADPQALLLDIVGLHPSSVEFHLHVLDSAERIWNAQKFRSRTGARLEREMRGLMRAGTDLLRAVGYAGSAPEIIEKFFASVQGPMDRPVIDASPLSETDELSACTEDGKNYIAWCLEKAAQAFDDLRQQRGFADGRLPNALLYHLLRHALQLGYYDAALRLHVASGLIDSADLARAYREPAFIHVVPGPDGASESRYRLLYATPTAITGDATRTVAEVIPAWLEGAGGTSVLADQLEALRVLEHAPTARLERAFAEHIDLCSYRWDAWTLSLANERLHTLRRPQGDQAERRMGLYLGAFGWLEDVRPHPSRGTPVTLNDELRAVFDAPGAAALERDPANGGHVLAPSLNHAVTAAVLRSGYLSHATSAEPDRFAVDLSSARVRVALQFIEGIRNGQPLGALLGYQLERRLHDRHAEAEMHTFIHELRGAFPLAGRRIADSIEGDAVDAPIEALEARNVCDGLLLLEHVRASATKTYPWEKNLARGTPAEEAIIDEEVRALFDIHDAIADLALAESVHQITMGNVDRAAAAMDAYGKSVFPPEPDVVKTPRSGTVLTHRLALHLPVGAVAGPDATPRAEAEPSIDRWLSDVLPPMDDLVVRVRFSNSAGDGAAQVDDVSMRALGLRPIDVLHLLDPGSEPAMNDLDDRLVRHVIATHGLCPDASLTIRYTEPVPGKKTAFETAPLIGSLRALLLNARPLKPSDAALESEASAAADAVAAVPPVQVSAVRSRVEALRDDASTLGAALAPLVSEGAAFDPVVGAVDASLAAFMQIQERAGLCGVALAGSGWAMKAARDWFALVRRNARKVAGAWQDKLSACDAHIAAGDDPTASDDARLDAFAQAERAVSTEYTVPLPATPGALRPTVIAKRGTFLAIKAQIEAVERSPVTPILALWTAWHGASAARRPHDIAVPDLSQEQRQVRVLMSDMHLQLTGLVAELDQRLARAAARMAAAAAAAGEQRARLLVEAVKALLGDAILVVPRFTLSADQADEWQNAFDARDALLAHASTLHEFPVDDWLYGVARVRPKLHDLEKVIQLTSAFELPEPAIVPLQFPFRPSDPWLALELPEEFDLAGAGEHLSYSALYAAGPFDKAASAHGGLLLDEWTEIIPSTKETAGLAFHYDRPSSEPPQTLLLVTPARQGERWSWLDLQLAIPETFDLARKRAAEPRDLSRTPLSRFLPATLMASTTSAISISSQLQAADVMFASGGPHA